MERATFFLAGRNLSYNNQILDIFQFPQGHLPIKYLGVPLITSKLSAADCKPLVESITGRIKSWTVRFLSYAGRLQLIQSVLCSVHSYWNGLFLLPKRIINQVEQLLRRFLWKEPDLANGGARVAWEELSFPLDEGGLGIKRLKVWNIAAMGKYLWNISQPSPSSNWALWARANLLRGRSLWEISIPNNASWTWRKLLQLRPIFRPLFKYSIGNGLDTWLWFDNWLPGGPIHPWVIVSSMIQGFLKQQEYAK